MFEFELPDLGEGVAEGEILTWHVAVGDRVEEDQVLAEVETDKAAVDVPSPVGGVVRELHYDPGNVVETGAVIVSIAPDEQRESGENASVDETDVSETAVAEDDTDTSAKGGRVFAPPSVRRLARELGVDITTVAGSGPSGRVTEDDVRTARDERSESTDSASGDAASSADERSESTDGASAASEAESGGDTQLKSAVSRVDDDEETGLKSAVSRVSADDSDDATVVKSAVSTVDSAAERDQTLATPATRKLAADLGVDIDAVPTDERRDGEAFVTPEAVRSHAARADDPDAETTASADADGTTDTERTGPRPGDRVPYRGVRRTIGQQMERSKFTAPHVTHTDQVDVTRLVETKAELDEAAAEAGVSLTYLPFVMRAVARALAEFPAVNASLDEAAEEIVYHDDYNLGVAAATDAGLLVPVVDNVDEKELLDLAAETAQKVEQARDRSIDRAEMQGGTFTITNVGVIGGEYATPIVNHPEVAILALGRIEKRPWVVDGEVVARHTLPLSLSVDHRVVDGAVAARFTNRVMDLLSSPAKLLVD